MYFFLCVISFSQSRTGTSSWWECWRRVRFTSFILLFRMF